MTQQSNGSASDGLPSLFGEVAAAGSSDKTISILSAVTGKEVSKSSARRKASPMGTFVLFLGLLITAMLGLHYWQSGEDTRMATSTHAPFTSVKTPALAVTRPATTTHVPQTVVKTPTPADTAVIEMVKSGPVPPSAELKKPEPFKALLAADHPVKSQAHPHVALTPPPPTKDKLAVKKVTVKSNHDVAKASPAETKLPNAEASKQKSVSVVHASGDPDEKLLEGMLRLMKRDNAKDKTNMGSAK